MAMDEQRFFALFSANSKGLDRFLGIWWVFQVSIRHFGGYVRGGEMMMKPAPPPSSSSECVVRGRS